MLARVLKTIHLSRGQKAVALAYGAVMAVSAGVTLVIMSAIIGAYAIPPEPTLYDNWVVVAGGLAAGIAMFLARGWMGGRGAFGFVRAMVATVIVTLSAAVIAGTLVSPFYGTLAGPFVLLSEFVANPLLAMAWFVVLLGSHFLIGARREEWEVEQYGSSDRAVSKLSPLSQANLYGR